MGAEAVRFGGGGGGTANPEEENMGQKKIRTVQGTSLGKEIIDLCHPAGSKRRTSISTACYLTAFLSSKHASLLVGAE